MAGDLMRVVCEACEATVEVARSEAGNAVDCPRCGSPVYVPCPDDLELRDEIERPRTETRPPERPLRLRDEAEEKSVPQDEPEAAQGVPVAPFGVPLCRWLRLAALLFTAFAVMKTIQAMGDAAAAGPTSEMIPWLKRLFSSPTDVLHTAMAPRPVVLGVITPLERFALGLVILVLAVRLALRSRVMDLVYASGVGRRTLAGAVFHFLMLVSQAGVIAWSASVLRMPGASDGMAGGLMAMLLLAGAVWSWTVYMAAGEDLPESGAWAAVDAAFGIGVVVVVLFPGLTVFWSRAGAAALIGLADAAAGFYFMRSVMGAAGWGWSGRLTFAAVCCISLVLFATILAAVR